MTVALTLFDFGSCRFALASNSPVAVGLAMKGALLFEFVFHKMKLIANRRTLLKPLKKTHSFRISSNNPKTNCRPFTWTPRLASHCTPCKMHSFSHHSAFPYLSFSLPIDITCLLTIFIMCNVWSTETKNVYIWTRAISTNKRYVINFIYVYIRISILITPFKCICSCFFFLLPNDKTGFVGVCPRRHRCPHIQHITLRMNLFSCWQ